VLDLAGLHFRMTAQHFIIAGRKWRTKLVGLNQPVANLAKNIGGFADHPPNQRIEEIKRHGPDAAGAVFDNLGGVAQWLVLPP
jgi:hypothetical protein